MFVVLVAHLCKFSRQLKMGLLESGAKQRYNKHEVKFVTLSLFNQKYGTIYNFGLQFSQSVNYFPWFLFFIYFLILSTFLSCLPIFPYLGLHSFFIFPLISMSFPLFTALWIIFFSPFILSYSHLTLFTPRRARISRILILCPIEFRLNVD